MNGFERDKLERQYIKLASRHASIISVADRKPEQEEELKSIMAEIEHIRKELGI